MRNPVSVFGALLSLLCLTACNTPWMTNTQRSAIEQYLISTTVDRCFSYTNYMNYSNKKAFMDYTYFSPQVDKQYVQGIIEARLSSFGVVIVKKQEEADIIVQPLCGVLGTDHDKIMIGIPSLPIPVPDTGLSFAIPEIPLFSKVTRQAYGKFSVYIFEAKNRKPLEAIERIRSSAKYVNWIVFLIPFKTHDLEMDDSVEGRTSFDFAP